MDIETKTVGKGYEEYLNFGWEHVENTRVKSARHSHTVHVLHRDREMQNYGSITVLENKYFLLKSQKKQYKPINAVWCLLGFVFFIIPGIIYVAVKSTQKRNIENYNNELQEEMNALLEEVKPLL